MGAAPGQRHHPHLRIRAPLGAMGLRSPEVRRVSLAVGHVEDRASIATSLHCPYRAPLVSSVANGFATSVNSARKGSGPSFTRAREIAAVVGTCHDPDQRPALPNSADQLAGWSLHPERRVAARGRGSADHGPANASRQLRRSVAYLYPSLRRRR